MSWRRLGAKPACRRAYREHSRPALAQAAAAWDPPHRPKEGSTMWKALLACLLLMAGTAAAAEPAGEGRGLYERVAAGPKAHHLPALRPPLLDSPTFLWGSGGGAVWGGEWGVAPLGC